MEGDPVEIALLREEHEAVDRVGRLVGVQLDHDVALVVLIVAVYCLAGVDDLFGRRERLRPSAVALGVADRGRGGCCTVGVARREVVGAALLLLRFVRTAADDDGDHDNDAEDGEET